MGTMKEKGECHFVGRVQDWGMKSAGPPRAPVATVLSDVCHAFAGLGKPGLQPDSAVILDRLKLTDYLHQNHGSFF